MSKPCGTQPRLVSPHALCSLPTTETVLVAFSGGADSSALLHLMKDYCASAGTKLFAAHVNHGIRGDEANRDEEFCRQTAASLGIELFVHRENVPEYAKAHSLSIETAAREVRYAFFDRIMEQNGIRILATAHNADDNLETMLFNLSRGCGLNGICGIPPARPCKHGYVVRPILSMSKAEILDYCAKRGIAFVTDSTNTDTDYTRNMIRANIIPALKEINSGVVENSARLASTLRSDAACLESLTDWFLEELCEDMSIDLQKLLGSPAAVADRAMIALYREISGGASMERTHVLDVRRLCERAVPHSRIQLPANTDACIENGRLYFEQRREKTAPPEDFCITLTEGVNEIPQINAKIIIGNSHISKNIYKNSTLLYIDSAKICGSLVARRRRPEDKIRINGINKSIKKLLCDKKIPLDVRYRLPMICDGADVVAVPHLATADKLRTKKDGLKIEFILND